MVKKKRRKKVTNGNVGGLKENKDFDAVIRNVINKPKDDGDIIQQMEA